MPDYCATIPPFPTSDIKSSDCEAAAAACTASADDCTNQVNMEIEAEDAVDLGSPAVCSGMYGVCGEKAGACFADATP